MDHSTCLTHVQITSDRVEPPHTPKCVHTYIHVYMYDVFISIVNWSKNDEGLKKTNMYGWHSTTLLKPIYYLMNMMSVCACTYDHKMDNLI